MTGAITVAIALLAAAHQAPPPSPAMQSPPPGGPDGARGGGGMRGAGMLRMADRNGDGIVTRDEYLAMVDARFAAADRNGDGVLSPDEMPNRGGWRGGRDGAGDTPPPPPPNGSSPGATGTPPAPPPPPPPGARGPITRARYREMAMRRFARWDTNGDGRIDQGEMAAATRTGPRGRRGDGDMPTPPADQ